MKFTYSSGQRPLDGYTIKRGIGRGGFGEVYFALSDGGKEVAMKVIRNNLDVELRGISQCLNFKSPNLVQLFDIREDPQGNHWVIMEYVSGESLNSILARHPEGVPAELARQWFQGLSDAVSYLHDHGVVHRDLKPGNIFIENGTVKVGDYGLCKCISGSQRSAQTQSVGTVHYMAPEISTGNYNKQIDIYAAGIILYEMLTGHVPFEGESAGEILMKHLTSPPDLSALPSPFVPILSKALAKNPAHRHRTMGELAKDVMATAPEGIPHPEPQKPLYVAKPIPTPISEAPPTVAPVKVPARTRMTELFQALLISALFSALFSILWAAVLRTQDLTTIGRYFFLGLACTWAILIPSKIWTRRVGESLQRRVALMAIGLLVGVLALYLEGFEFPGLFVNSAHANSAAATTISTEAPINFRARSVVGSMFRTRNDLPIVACYLSYFGLAFFAMRWWQLTDRRRSNRFSFYSVMAAGLIGYFLILLCPGPEGPLGVVSLVMAAIIVQLVSPWEKPIISRPRKLRLPNA